MCSKEEKLGFTKGPDDCEIVTGEGVRERIPLAAVTKWSTFRLQHKITERNTHLPELRLMVTETYIQGQEGRMWDLLKASLSSSLTGP